MPILGNFLILTEAHSTESCFDNQHNDRNDIAIQCQIENGKAEHEHESCLKAHHHELSHDVPKENFHSGYARNETPFQHALVSLDQHCSRRQRHRQEEDDSVELKNFLINFVHSHMTVDSSSRQLDSWSSKISKIGILCAIHWHLKRDGNFSVFRIDVTLCHELFDEIKVCKLNVTI